MTRPRTIDCHTHILTEEAMRLLAKQSPKVAPNLTKPALEFLISTAGHDRVLLGSDYPFDMGNLDCVARVRALSIEPAARDLILGGYARTVLGEPTRSVHA